MMVATRQYDAGGRRVLASAPNLQTPLWGITLEHPQFTEPHWLVNRPYVLSLTLEDASVQVYNPCYFQLVLPKMDGKGQQDAQISIQNVDRRMVQELELANTDPREQIRLTLRLFLEDDPEAGPQNIPLELSLSSVQANASVITGTAGRSDILNRPYPLEVYRIDRWPGLDR